MMDVLFLAHRVPYPPDKGDKIRSWHLLQWLTARYHVHLGGFVDDPADWAHVDVLHRCCASTCLIPLDRWSARLRCLKALAAGRPLTFAHFGSAELSQWVRTVHRERHVVAQIAFSSAMAPYIEPFDHCSGTRIVDFVDVDSEKWAAYAERRGASLAWLFRREARLLRRAEQEIARAADASLVVSIDEAAALRRIAGAGQHRIRVVGNGVDTDHFDPGQDFATPFANASGRERAPGPNIVFTGAMDYWPNIDAVAWFASEILPRIVADVPTARFHIVGARPARAVRRLESASVTVTGRVEDVRPHLRHADLVVVPLRVTRGIQNKLLEAMAMGRAIVATPAAFSGIEGDAGRDLLLAADAEGFARSCTELLRSDAARYRLGANARRLVQGGYSWAAQFEPLRSLIPGDYRAPARDHPIIAVEGHWDAAL